MEEMGENISHLWRILIVSYWDWATGHWDVGKKYLNFEYKMEMVTFS